MSGDAEWAFTAPDPADPSRIRVDAVVVAGRNEDVYVSLLFHATQPGVRQQSALPNPQNVAQGQRYHEPNGCRPMSSVGSYAAATYERAGQQRDAADKPHGGWSVRIRARVFISRAACS